MTFSTISTTEKTSIIGFTSPDKDKIDDYFDKFRYANQKDIVENGYHHFILNDGTYIKKIYNPSKVNRLFQFDQYILADSACGMLSRIKQSSLLKNIKWSNKVPEEYQIIYLDMGLDLNI